VRPDGRHALVLAAGAASRFGGGKLVVDWRGAPLVTWAVRAALAAQVDQATVVLGAEADQVQRALTQVVVDDRLRLVEALDWDQGQSASLRAGVRALPADARAVAVFLGDMPSVDPAMADRLLDAVLAGAPAARLRSPRGPAHPAAFSAEVFPDLLALTGDQGARSLFDRLGAAVAVFETDHPGATLDIDTPGDLVLAGPLSS
jgi:molybdenum cofactor cytidylyltransferase